MAEKQSNGCCRGNGESHPCQSTPASGVSRRSFIQTVGVSAAGAAVADRLAAQARAAQPGAKADDSVIGPDAAAITLTINGKPTELTVDPATTLLEALRIHANLTGAKEVCDRGACGACSVLIDGELTVSCMMLAVDAVGTQITTVEGLARGDELDPVQKCFVKHDGMQCGYCTPGLVMASRALLNQTPRPTLDQIKHGLSGNICRCGTYTNIFNAVLEASGQDPITDPDIPAEFKAAQARGGER